MNTAEHPPFPRVALNVGVTGHRPKDFNDADMDTLRERIREVLEFLQEFATNLPDLEDWYQNPGRPLLRVISAVAEGADRLVALQGLDLGFELQCPLPFDRLEYAKDFRSDGSVLEFNNLLLHPHTTAVLELDGVRNQERDPRDLEAQSYEQAGRVVLSQSDVLIAIWNGEERNKKGGTSQVVGQARQRNIPTVWIKSQAPHEVNIWIAGGTWTPWAVGSGALARWLEALLHPPAPKEDEEAATSAADYFAESQPARTWGWLWLPFRNLWADHRFTRPAFKVANFAQSGRQEWEPILRSSGAFSEETRGIMNNAALLDHYGWADGLAGYYGNLYRSAFVANYLLGALAVLFAVLHFALKDHQGFDWSLVFTMIELAALSSVLLIYGNGKKGGWHQRLVDYRLLAEYIRQMLFLVPLGPGEVSSPHIPAHMAGGDPKTTWMYWHYRSVRREIGLIRARFSSEYLESIRSFTCKDCIGSQVEYHRNNARRFQVMDQRFARWAKYLFILALVAACFAALLHWEYIKMMLPASRIWPMLPGVLTAGAATVFPAVGAALAGIRSQGEFERVKKRSKAMTDALEVILKQLRATAKGNVPMLSIELNEDVAGAGQLMVDELLDWRIVFKDRPLPEPE
jgi:hypothetical protein